ncbi:prophage pi3 protein 37 [Lactococcus lactis subsp. lactis]|uniref:Prophage pi3 protein 37 n=1 Tax=Lactococcus lactis subsp. lactis TaxID=1360 RepID=A0A0V8E6Y2_LACLL|nr:DUF1642 domain-containing protein [Lactococcus lactis]KSU21559.1 prophage pi3 protein 37 [Lactococcus lactis subsp. lactis]
MTKNDYIEKITQNLEHLTKDELKDVSILTTAQLGVRSKFAERQQLEHEIENLMSQLQQQALPVVPECVAEWIEHCKGMGYDLIAALTFKLSSTMHEELSAKILKWLGDEGNNDELFARAWLDGYTVEKPQLFYLREKNTGYYLRKKGNNEYGITPHYSNDYDEKYMHYKFTKQEIDSMQTGSYELVPVEDGE